MDLKNVFKPYDETKDDLKFITTSDIKIKIIISLIEEQKKLSDLKRDIHIRSSTILHNMRQLENRNLVIKEFQDYSLSQTGEILALNLISIINSIYLAKKNKDFWLSHEIEDIPRDLINKIECISNIEILEHESVINLFKKFTIKSKNINWIHNNSIRKDQLIEALLNKKNCLNFILTEDSITEIKNENLEKFFKDKNIRLWKNNNKNLKLYLIVFDDLMCLNVPNISSNPEKKLYLISQCKEGIKWGHELFDHYLNQSEEFKMD